MMFDVEKIEDLSVELIDADRMLRKSLMLPDDMENPAAVVSKLCGLARSATAAAQALSIIMTHARDRELIAARIRAEQA